MTGWRNLDYVGDIWRAAYEPTGGDPRCNRLRTELRQNRILSEVVLYEGPSPSQAVTRSGDATLRAATFDWYVPVVSPWSSYVDIAMEIPTEKFTSGGGKEMMLSTGGVSIHLLGNDALAPVPMRVMSGPSPLVATRVDELLDIGDFVSLTDVSLDKAERRHVKIEDVVVKWQLNWTVDKLEVRLFGRPEDRPFQAHIVVEETVYSGETFPENLGDVLSDQGLLERIHTPFVAEMINQLVFVPEIFFREELRAFKRGDKMLGEFERRFAQQAPVGPGDPIEFLQKSVREMASRSSSTSTLAAVMDERVEFATRQAPELWDSVLREAQCDTGAS